MAAAAAALGMAETDFIARHTVLARNRAQLSLREAPGGACEFLGAGNYCRIHAARPRQCREFPLGWQVAGCPGLDPRAGQNGRVFHCVENAGGPTMRAACGRFPTK